MVFCKVFHKTGVGKFHIMFFTISRVISEFYYVVNIISAVGHFRTFILFELMYFMAGRALKLFFLVESPTVLK